MEAEGITHLVIHLFCIGAVILLHVNVVTDTIIYTTRYYIHILTVWVE